LDDDKFGRDIFEMADKQGDEREYEFYQTFKFNDEEYGVFVPLEAGDRARNEFMAVTRHEDGSRTFSEITDRAEFRQVEDYYESMLDDDTAL